MDGSEKIEEFCAAAGPQWQPWRQATNGTYRRQLLRGESGKFLFCYDIQDGMTVFVDASERDDEGELREVGSDLSFNWEARSSRDCRQ